MPDANGWGKLDILMAKRVQRQPRGTKRGNADVEHACVCWPMGSGRWDREANGMSYLDTCEVIKAKGDQDDLTRIVERLAIL